MCLENLELLVEGASLVEFAVEVWRAKFERYVTKFEAAVGPQQGAPEGHTLLVEEADGGPE